MSCTSMKLNGELMCKMEGECGWGRDGLANLPPLPLDAMNGIYQCLRELTTLVQRQNRNNNQRRQNFARGGPIRTGASSSGVTRRAAPYRRPNQASGQRNQVIRGAGVTRNRTSTDPHQGFACGGVRHFRNNCPSISTKTNQATG